jgi:hypothetical protein
MTVQLAIDILQALTLIVMASAQLWIIFKK